jgi:hypothetical protein
VEEYGTARQATDDNNTAHALCMLKDTVTHPEYVIVIAFPQQQWLRELASYIAYLVCIYICLGDVYHEFRVRNI